MMLDILFPAFLLSLVLLGIHSYFGLEIIDRGIIFTDLAIGQMAAMGAAISLLLFHGHYSYLTSLVFALLAGLLISVGSKRVKCLEAYIGLIYAFGISAVFILLSKSAHGMEAFHDLMAADILFTPLREIVYTALFYSVLGLFIYFVVRKSKGFMRDILFFTTFSLTVTSSVKMAGVLTIFALLISPALIVKTLGSKRPVLTAWGIGTLINIVALGLSYQLDLPTGYTLVFLHALTAFMVSLIKRTKHVRQH
jgi:zinc/manganese transport system permease protein